MKNKQKGFSVVLILPVVLLIGIAGFLILIKMPASEVLNKKEAENTSESTKVDSVDIDTSKTLFHDSLEFTYKFFEDHSKYLVSKINAQDHTQTPIKELGFYYKETDKYEPLYLSEKEELSFDLSPNKDYILIADVIQDPMAEINYKLVQTMKIINLNTLEQITVPFPNNRMFAGTLWNLKENEIYVTARKPEGMDYAFKWYYEFNLNSKDFRLIATSDDFVLEYGDNKKNFGHFILHFGGFDSTGKTIIGIGQAPEDPHLLTVWRINPDSREFTKLYDYNVDTKYGHLITDRYINDRRFVDDKLNIHSFTQQYSMNLSTGEITDLGQEYDLRAPSLPKFKVDRYEYISHNRDPWYYTLKDLNTNEEHTFMALENGNSYKDYRIITNLD